MKLLTFQAVGVPQQQLADAAGEVVDFQGVDTDGDRGRVGRTEIINHGVIERIRAEVSRTGRRVRKGTVGVHHHGTVAGLVAGLDRRSEERFSRNAETESRSRMPSSA